jgi:hypothetical protein
VSAVNGPLSATQSAEQDRPRGTGTATDGAESNSPEGSSVTTGVELSDAVHRLCDYIAETSRHAGYETALRDVAGRQVELADAWHPIGRATHEQRVAERVALFERCAARLAEKMGRPAGYAYRGGAVPVWPADPPKEDPYDRFARELWEEAR